jgi:acylpyruvate hydrolase
LFAFFLPLVSPPLDVDQHTPIRDHIAELNSARPKQPFFFLKPSTSILLPGEGPVIRPRGVDLHYEVELALIMGKTIKDLEETDVQGAFDAIDSMYLQETPAPRPSANQPNQAMPWALT